MDSYNSDQPPPQYTPTPAPPGSNHHYPSHSDAHSQSLNTYNNGQAMNPSPYGYDTRPYPANLNHGHYASAPRPGQAYGVPHVSDTGSYGAFGDPYGSNRGPSSGWAYDPHGAGTGSYEAPRDAHTPNTGSYQTYHVPYTSDTEQYSGYREPHVSETRPYVQHQSFPSSSRPANSAYLSPSDVGVHSGASQPTEYGHNWHPRSSPSQPSPAYRTTEYPSSQAPEKQRYHASSDAGRGGDTLTAKVSAERARGGDARADASNAMPVSNFKMNQTVRAYFTTDTWVMGVIIGVAHLCSKVTGRAYWVEFESVEGRKREAFSETQLKPCRPGS